MKSLLSKFLFWLVLAVVLIATVLAYFLLVRPISKENRELAKQLEQQLTELKGFEVAPKIVNERWFKYADEYVKSVKEQNRKCYEELKKYRHDWDKPFKGAEAGTGRRAADPDVFKYVYKEEKSKFEEKAKQMIVVKGYPFKWPEADNTEDRILFIQRYYWVQEALLDVLVAGKAKNLLVLNIDFPPSDEGKSLYQVGSFDSKLHLPLRDLPALVQSLLTPERKFFCVIDSLKIAKDEKAQPVMKGEQPVEEPFVEITLFCKFYLFQEPPAQKMEGTKSS